MRRHAVSVPGRHPALDRGRRGGQRGQSADDPLDADAIRAVMRRACDYQLRLQANPADRGDNGWIRASFYTGVMAALRATGDDRHLEQAFAWVERHAWTPPPSDDRHADSQACIQIYAELSMFDRRRACLEPSLSAFDRQLATPRRGRGDWCWCDALYMAPPGLARSRPSPVNGVLPRLDLSR
jgi:unsaturated rhamnogalacturonyl hydrolase